jgi:hypothetical protein
MARAFAILLIVVAAASCAGRTANGARSTATQDDRCAPLRDGEPGCEADGKVYPEHCPKPKAEWCQCEWMETDPTLAFGVVASVKPTIVRSIGWACAE